MAILAGALLLNWSGGEVRLDVGALMIVGACVAWGIDNNSRANGDEAIRREHMFYARHHLNDHRHIDLEAGRMDRFLPVHAREQHLPRYWIHGHTHSSFDYRIGRCRVVCNPRGYGRENLKSFRHDLVLTAG